MMMAEMKEIVAAYGGSDYAAKAIIESGSAVQAIIECAENRKFDLIVMGTRGLSAFRKALLGSVSSGVVSHATCSVLVVR